MADDDAKGSGRSRFKSKWGKILKQSDDLKSLGDSWSNKKGKNANSQEEVDDFLKPSIERAATNRPRLDVSIAQRWPDTNDVRQAAGGFPLDTTQNVNGWRKKRRREGLTVGFVKTVPETIGHGGDETLDPPSDIAMQKARNVSAAVDSRPAGSGDRSSLPMPNALNEPRRQPPSKVDNQFDDRMLPNQRPIHPRWNEEPPPPKIGISRAPTGYSTLDESGTPEDERLRGPTLPDTSQQLDSRLAPQTEEQDSDRLKVSPTPRNPHTLVARKQNDMRANEGMALRRASAMIEPLDIEDDGDLDLGLYAAATATHRAEAAATPPTHVSDRPPVIPSIDAIPPPSDAEPDSPSPFADSRYLKRHSREEPLAQQRKQEEEIMSPGPPQGARSPFADPKYLKSRSRDPSPSKPLRQGDVDPVATVHLADEASQQYQDLLPQSNPLASPPPGGDHRTMPLQHNNFENSAHQPREGPATRLEPTVPDLRPRPEERTDTTKERSLQRGTARSVSHENAPPSYGRPMPAPRLNTEPQDQSHGRDPTFDPQAIMQRPMAGTRSPNGPRPIVQGNHPSSGGHSRNNSYNKASPQSIPSRSEDTGSELSPQASLSQATPGPSLPEIAASMKSANYLGPRPYEPRHHGSSSQLAPPEASPYARRPSTNDYFELERQHPQQPAKSPLNHSLRPDDHSRPGSAHSNRSFLRSQPPPQDAPSETSAADAAFEDFASRVAHMKGVFRLTAEKEQPAEKCSPYMWLRNAYWWYLRGKVGLETLLRQRAKYREAEHRELLTQPHVDLAKTSWILSDPLEDLHHSVQQGHSHTPDSHALLLRDVRILKDCLKSLSQSMLKANIMPPPQSLIQGQDTQIWLDYPKFTPDLEAVLGGVGDQNPSLVNKYTQPLSASDALPLGDTESHHCYSRFLVNVFMNTEDVSTDRISVPCTLTVLRGKQEYQSTIVISSQSQLVNLKVAPRQSEPKALNWQDVSWKASSLSITINLPQGVHANIRLFEQNFRTLWNLVEYSRRVDHSLRHEDDEVLVHDMPLVEVQYADTSNPNAFPQDKVKHCRMLVWERLENFQNMGAMRKRHRGFHVLVVTEPTHKTLSYFSHRICANGPLFFEFITDAAAHGTTAMVIRVREESKECRMLLVFPDAESRQSLYNKLNGIDVRSDETIIGKMSLAGLSVEALNENANAALSGKGDFSYLQWQRLGVTNHFIENTNSRLPSTVESESLRIIARHGHGCITDRLNLDKGELLLRLPCTDSPTVQLLRQPQIDLTMSIDARNAPPRTSDSVADVFKVIQNHHTVRTFTFTTPYDLHAFETAITGLTVLYDGLASTLGISRRMMVVPIYHKWTASNVRIQILANAQSTVFQLIAFMDDFAHADALCFQIKSTDVFETIKGDAKGKKWAVKMVDAKFSLPPALSGKEGDERPAEERAKGRFVNLEGLDYAQEHDDIAVGFESQEARDEFAKALPAATKKSHMITLKRRI